MSKPQQQSPPSTTTSSPPPPPPSTPPPASSSRSLLSALRRSPVTTLVAAFFLLALFMYGEDVRTLAELSIDDYLYPDADFYNVSALPPLLLPPPTCDLSRGRWVFDNTSLPAYREKECTFLTKQRIISPERIESHANNWKDVDYLIFNTYIWWMNNEDIKVRRPNSTSWSDHDEVPRIETYGRVFKTWSTWLEQNVDPARTSVFFMTISPLHNSPAQWGNPNGIKCVKETLPVLNYTKPLDLNHDMRMYDLVAKVAKNMKNVPVSLIDITRMSDYRKDAHTSLYSIRQGKLLTPEQKADPQKYADCIHWCLPGVPDVWNQILYTRILSKSSPPSTHPSLPPQ
uniref:Trichome birefringence-like C-terminal domain-containing protein n=1 Tax=Oryza nivara TaxID=4536 RepID=A0A0E0J5T1_ORYNI